MTSNQSTVLLHEDHNMMSSKVYVLEVIFCLLKPNIHYANFCFPAFSVSHTLYGLQAQSVSWPEAYQIRVQFVLLIRAVFFCFSFVYRVCVVFCFLVFGCQCKYNPLPGMIHLRNGLLCVKWDIKPYTLTHSQSP